MTRMPTKMRMMTMQTTRVIMITIVIFKPSSLSFTLIKMTQAVKGDNDHRYHIKKLNIGKKIRAKIFLYF